MPSPEVTHRARTPAFVPVLMPLLLATSIACVAAGCCLNRQAACVPETGVDFALYDPAYEDDGVWEEEVVALKSMFQSYGWGYDVIGPEDLNAGRLEVDGRPKYKALIAPGGYAYQRNQAVSAAGEAHILDFVARGGNYVGFCAGSFWPSASVVWAEQASGAGGSYNVAADYATYPYELKLFTGAAQGPFGWTPWASGTNASLQAASINLESATMAAIGMPATTRFFYYGGPFFVAPDPPPDGWEVWARAAMPSGTPASAGIGDGQPTVVRFRSGEGSVILFSYHPEILIDSDVDGVTLATYIHEDAVSWDTGSQTQAQINLLSWNIAHAALQIAAGEAVTPLTTLP